MKVDLSVYKELFDSMVLGAVFYDEQGNFIEANKAARQILGYSNKELINTTFYSPEWKMIGEDGRTLQEVEHPVKICLSTGRKVNDKVLGFYNKKLKETRWVHVNCTPLLKKDNTGVYRVLVTLIDITERKLADEKLRVNEGKFHVAFDSAPSGMSILAADGHTFLTVNPQMCEMLGYNREELIGNSVSLVIHPDDLEQRDEWVRKKFKNEPCEPEIEKRYVHKDGHIIWGLLRAQWIKNVDGTPMMAIVHVLDITKRKQAEEALLANEKLFRAMIENNADAIVMMNSAGNIIYESPTAYRLSGYTPDERINRSGFDTVFIEDREKVRKVISDLVNNKGVTVSIEFRAIRKDGTIWWAEGIATNLFHEPHINAIVINYRDITDRIKSQERLKITQFGIDHSQTGILNVDEDGSICYANNHICEILGFNREEILQQKIWEVDVSLKESFFQKDEIKNRQNDTMTLESHLKKKNGSLIPVEVTIDFIEFKNKILSFAFIKDISERKRVEKSLSESEELFRSMFEEGQFGIALSDSDAKFINVNPAFCNMLGFSAEELKNKTFAHITHPDRVKEDQKNILALSRGEIQHYKTEKLYVKKNGEFLWGSLIVKTIQDDEGKVKYFIAMIQDITDRKKTEDALHQQNNEYQALNEEYLAQNEELVDSLNRIQKINEELQKAKEIAEESEKKYKAAFYTSPDSININTLDGIYLDINSGFTEITGYTAEEIIGKSSVEYNIWANLEDRIKLVKGLSEKGVVENLETTFIMKNGEKKTGLMSAVIIPINGVPHILSITRDITFRKRMENDLIKAKEKAEESDRLKSAFLANMSHEIRTPMNGILGFAELLKEPELTGLQQKKYIEVIQQSGYRMLSIINDLIDIAKIEAGQIELKTGEINLNRLLDNVYAFFNPEAEMRDINLLYSKSLPPDKSFIITDETKLTQVLSNLIKNALKFTEKGSVEYGYQVKKVKDQNDDNGLIYLEFYVKDTGIGIKPEFMEKIFERFTKAELSGKKIYEGAGLGLSISKAYVEIMGGHIVVDSVFGEGSVFTFTLPLIQSEKRIKSMKKPDDRDDLILDIEVLVAEDDDVSYMFIDEILRKNGIKSFRAENGLIAVESVKSNRNIDLVLMDLKMPELDGLEATVQIKKIRPDLPVIAQTAFASYNDKMKSLDAGCVDYISKPINKELLIEKIMKYTAKPS